MKLIEALKQVKELKRKHDDLKDKISKFCAYLSHETPTYPDQKKQVAEWLQAQSDLLKTISELKIAIAKTNLATQVTVDLGGKQVTKSIAEWVIRRQDLAALELAAWKQVGDRGLREGHMSTSTGTAVEVKIVRCYDPVERDKKVDLLTEEPTLIDQRLEIANAVTDLVA